MSKYFIFYPDGNVVETEESGLSKIANKYDQWEDEGHELGQLYLPVAPDEMTKVSNKDGVMLITHHPHPTNNPDWAVNTKISKLLGDTIYGIAYIKAKDGVEDKIRKQFV